MKVTLALKFGGRIEDQAMGRLLAALSKASLEPDGDIVLLIIEDALAKNWLQGQLKINQQIFDHSFNTEIIKVSIAGLFDVLNSVFDPQEIEKFKVSIDTAQQKKTHEARIKAFKKASLSFAEDAAKAAGGEVLKVLKAHIGL